MATIQQVADAIQGKLATISGLNAYSEAQEMPHSPAAEVVFNGRTRDTSGGGQLSSFIVDVSVSADDSGWEAALQRVRAYAEETGASSVEAALYADDTLGGVVSWVAVRQVLGERVVVFGSDKRWLIRVVLEVNHE